MISEITFDEVHPAIERILVVEHPSSKNGARGHRQLQDLVDYSELPVDTIFTDRDPKVTTQHVLELLELTDLLYEIGGDGSANPLAEPLMQTQALFFPTRSGNANDLARSLNGRKSPSRVYADYLHGNVRATSIHPIEVTIDDGITNETAHAFNYASFGYAALAANHLNDPWQHPRLRQTYDALPRSIRNMVRMPREAILLGKAAREAAFFEFTTIDSDGEAKATQAVDVSIVHSERMAKLGRFNVRHTSPEVFTSVLTKTGVVPMGVEFIKMMCGKMAGEYATGLAFQAVNTTGKTLYYQVDGEAFPLPDKSVIKVGLSPSTLRVLSSRLY